MDRGLQVGGFAEADALRDQLGAQQFLRGEVVQRFQGEEGRIGEVVGVVGPQLLVETGELAHQLRVLQCYEAAFDSQGVDVELGLRGQAPGHLEALGDEHQVADGDLFADLEGVELVEDAAQAVDEAGEGGQGLVGAADHLPGGLHHVPVPVHEQRDRGHRSRHRHHGNPGGLRGAVGGAVAGAGLSGRQVTRGDEVNAGGNDAAEVVGQDDGAVEFCQFPQGLGGELDVEPETTGGDLLHLRVVPQHDQSTRAAVQDAVQPGAQRGAGREASLVLA